LRIRMLMSFLSAFLICAICVACSRQDDAEKVRLLIAKGASLAEAHDLSGLLQLASKDVRASPRDLDRRGIKKVLWQTFNYYGQLKVLYPRPVVEMKDEAHEASAQFPFLIVRKEQTLSDLEGLRSDPIAWIEKIGETADLYRLRLLLTKQDGTWFVNRAYLERFNGTGFE